MLQTNNVSFAITITISRRSFVSFIISLTGDIHSDDGIHTLWLYVKHNYFSKGIKAKLPVIKFLCLLFNSAHVIIISLFRAFPLTENNKLQLYKLMRVRLKKKYASISLFQTTLLCIFFGRLRKRCATERPLRKTIAN